MPVYALPIKSFYNDQMIDLDQLFRLDTPLMDVRAPAEFSKGAFPSAHNLPILDDSEREQVGICYRQKGPDAAVALGHQLVSGKVREHRTAAWTTFLERHPDASIYCFRGGQRSDIACSWLRAEGFDVPRIEGGYKRLRNHLLRVFERPPHLMLVGGKTGVGKTLFLEQFSNAVDLELIANHRGSAFGRRITPQPSQIDFENRTAIEFIKKSGCKQILLEDEGHLIGRIHLPLPLQTAMQSSPLLLVEESQAKRTENILEEYVIRQWQEYQASFGDEAQAAFSGYLLDAVDAIRKRLGNRVHGEIRASLQQALQTNDLDMHRQWIAALLTDYYDPMYSWQLSRKEERICFRGSASEAAQWYCEKLSAD